MKKILVLLITLITFGCDAYGPYNYTPSASSLRSEHVILIQEARTIASDSKDCQKREFEFCLGLTDEQLKLYDKLISAMQADFQTGIANNATTIIKARALQHSLSEEKWQSFTNLLEERGRITQRALDVVSREKALLKQWQTGKEVAQYKYQQSQRYWQNFNENYQRELDRQAYGYQSYGYPPVIITQPSNK